MANNRATAPTTTVTRSANDDSLTFCEVTTRASGDLIGHYKSILGETRVSWTEQHRTIRRLGSGGQGVVFLCERVGADHFTLPVALKVFSPEFYPDPASYDAAMVRMAQVAVRIAL